MTCGCGAGMHEEEDDGGHSPSTSPPPSTANQPRTSGVAEDDSVQRRVKLYKYDADNDDWTCLGVGLIAHTTLDGRPLLIVRSEPQGENVL